MSYHPEDFLKARDPNMPQLEAIIQLPRSPATIGSATHIFWEDFPETSVLVGREDEAVIPRYKGDNISKTYAAFESITRLLQEGPAFSSAELVKDQEREFPELLWSNAHYARSINAVSEIFHRIAGRSVLTKEMHGYGNRYELAPEGGLMLYHVTPELSLDQYRKRQVELGIPNLRRGKYQYYRNHPAVLGKIEKGLVAPVPDKEVVIVIKFL